MCGKQEKCKNCGVINFGTPLYPVYYSDTPYNATEFAKRVMLNKVGELAKVDIPKELYSCLAFMQDNGEYDELTNEEIKSVEKA